MGAVCTARLALGCVSEDSLLCAPRGHRHTGLRLQGLPGRLSLVCALDTKRLGRRGARGPPGPSPWPAPHVSVTLQTLMGEEWPGQTPLRLSAPTAGSAPSQLPPRSSCKNTRKRTEPSLKHRDVSQVRVSFPRPLSLGLKNNPQQAKRKTETQRLGLNPSGLSATQRLWGSASGRPDLCVSLRGWRRGRRRPGERAMAGGCGERAGRDTEPPTRDSREGGCGPASREPRGPGLWRGGRGFSQPLPAATQGPPEWASTPGCRRTDHGGSAAAPSGTHGPQFPAFTAPLTPGLCARALLHVPAAVVPTAVAPAPAQPGSFLTFLCGSFQRKEVHVPLCFQLQTPSE